MLSLKEKQAAIQSALDYDEVKEVRLALEQRKIDLERLSKKMGALGLDIRGVRACERIINGDEIRPGLLGIIAQHGPASEQQDVFFDSEQGPGAEIPAARGETAPLTSEQLETLLALVEDDVPAFPGLVEIDGWTEAERREVGEWATALHLAASDQDVEVPAVPRVLVAAREGLAVIPEAEGARQGNEPGAEDGEDGWLPTAESLEQARIQLGKHVGREWGDVADELQETQPELARTIRYVSKHGWGGPTRPSEVRTGMKVKTTTDLRKSYRVANVFDDRVEVEWNGARQWPLLGIDELDWDTGRRCWMTHETLTTPVEDLVGGEDADGRVTAPWEEASEARA